MKNETDNKTILVIMAHPDDESYGMGGTLAKYSRLGAQVILLCATLGEAGIKGVRPETAGRMREQELKQAAEHLQIKAFFLDYFDGTLSQLKPNELRDRISIWIDAVAPGIIITFGPDGISGHPDHIAISNAVTGAVEKYFPDSNLLYLAPSEATLLGCGVSSAHINNSKPLIAVDINGFKINKVKAIQSHKSQNLDLTGDPQNEVEKIACFEQFSIVNTSHKQIEDLKWFQENAGQV